MTQSGICRNITVSRDTLPAFSFDILPEAVRNLKICELVKKENTLLVVKSGIQQREILQLGGEKLAVENQLKKERRKRKFVNVVRTVVEVVVIVVIITL